MSPTSMVQLPVVPTLGAGGYREVSIVQALTDGSITDVVDGPEATDGLTGAAVFRLLLAITAAAREVGVEPAEWVAEHAHDFELVETDRPFAQCGHLRPGAPSTQVPASRLVMFAAGTRSILLDHTHHESGLVLSLQQAVRLLLVRSMFGMAARQPFSTAPFGMAATSGKNPVCLTRPFLRVVTGAGLAADLDANLMPGLGRGRFHFTFDAGWTPGTDHTPTGPLDVLTWPSRASLLLPDSDGQVRRVVLAEGARWDAADPQLQPHAAWRMAPGPKKSDPAFPSAVRAPVDAGWTRRLLTAWADPARLGIIGQLRELETHERAGWSLHLSGLAADKGRIDGVAERRLPVPVVPDETITQWLEQVVDSYRFALGRTRGALAVGLDGTRRQFAPTNVSPVSHALDDVVDELSLQVAAGTLSVQDASAALRQAGLRAGATHVRTHTLHTRSLAGSAPMEET